MDTSIIEEQTNVQAEEIKSPDCKDFLNDLQVTYEEEGYYLSIINYSFNRGWVLHMSAIRLQMSDLLTLVLPILLDSKVSFKIPKTMKIGKNMQYGNYGIKYIGKTICIYPDCEEKALELAKSLVILTKDFKGPAVSGDRFLGGTVYTRYLDPASHSQLSENYTGTFLLPTNVKWPFEELVTSIISPAKPLLNNKYKLLSILKPDIKGRVIQANYFKSFFNIRSCVIKEGVKDMWADEYGRDVADRLKWQYRLYKELGNDLPMPEIFDLFQDEDNSYLAMEFIKGESLNTTIASTFNGESWFRLSIDQKNSLIDYYQKIICIIEKLHKKGYVHRDITPANFIINKKKQIFLIDMELTYSISEQWPNPAFKQGTPGYMSPEQIQFKTPTPKEDIYALGALMLLMFTGISPIKIDIDYKNDTLENLSFFTDSPDLIVPLIQSCMSLKPAKRPALEEIRMGIEKYRNQVNSTDRSNVNFTNHDRLNSTQLRLIISKAIAGISSDRLMSPDYVWTSPVQRTDDLNIQSDERIIQPGFNTGLAGILFFLAKSHKSGYDISSCIPAFHSSWEFLFEYIDSNPNEDFTLFDGMSGIAIALQEGISSGLLSDQSCKTRLLSCISHTSQSFNLAHGIAGQLLATLRCRHLNAEYYEPILKSQVNYLIEHQQTDGSWNNLRRSKRDNLIGFAYGTSGILATLIAYSANYIDGSVTKAIEKGMHWLQKCMKIKKGEYYWNTSTKSKSIDKWSCAMGVPGIALTFVKAYELTNESVYKKTAENILTHLAKQPTIEDCTHMSGVSGLGEIYLEASRILREQNWLTRANWIANSLVRTVKQEQDRLVYWSSDISPEPKVDLLTGSSGIIHFLMRCEKQDQIGHLLLSV